MIVTGGSVSVQYNIFSNIFSAETGFMTDNFEIHPLPKITCFKGKRTVASTATLQIRMD